MKVVSVGDNVIDYYEELNKGFPGGNAVNVSVFLKRLGIEDSKYIGIIGNDHHGNALKTSLNNENVDIKNLRTAIGETGLTSVTLNSKGDRFFNSWNHGGVQAELKLNFTNTELDIFKDYDLLHTSVYSYLEEDIEKLSKVIDISFDFSVKCEEQYIKNICPHLKYAFFSGGDMTKEHIDTLIEFVHSLGTKYVVITLGEKGAIMSVNGKYYFQNAYQAKVKDTLGAGDSFIASILYYMYKTADISLALDKSSQFAAKTCEYYGAF